MARGWLAALGVGGAIACVVLRWRRRRERFAKVDWVQTELLTVESLTVYPVKSFTGGRVTSACLDAYGLVGDRRMMIYTPGQAPRFVTQRQLPRMALVRAELVSADKGLRLSWLPARGMASIWDMLSSYPKEITVPVAAGDEISVGIWDDTVTAYDLGDEVAAWLSGRLRRNLRACWTGPEFKRAVDRRYTPEALAASREPQVHFGDGYPILLCGTASLDDLNSRLLRKGEVPVTMDRFRPNVVVRTATPYEEDTWKRIRIGPCEFVVAKGCSRCKIPTVEPRTGVAHRKAGSSGFAEPLDTLHESRKVNDEVYVRFPGAARAGTRPLTNGPLANW